MTRLHRLRLSIPAFFLAFGLMTGCLNSSSNGAGSEPKQSEPPPETERTSGATSFLSADASIGQNGLVADETLAPGDANFQGADPNSAPPQQDSTVGSQQKEEASVEEGDIYKVLGNGLLANLNAYRGLQLIDLSDVSNPKIIGRAAISGSPVEMYSDGDIVFVLMNNWTGYRGGYGAVDVEKMQGGVVASVDISDPENPVVIDKEYIPAYIQKSRMVKGTGRSALYVAAQNWGHVYYAEAGGAMPPNAAPGVAVDATVNIAPDSATSVSVDAAAPDSASTYSVIVSFDVSDGTIAPKSQLDLVGYIVDIQATPEAFLAASNSWTSGRSSVAVVDISDPGGEMIESSSVETAGMVENQFNMDLYKGILRIASQGWNANYVETFDASDLSNIQPIDSKTFGEGEQLFATLFLEEKAFLVTYFRQDPFHAFEIDAQGAIVEKSEFIVSGWNDYFRPALDGTRLIGIGVNDESSRNMAVSLYDITDMANPAPLVARAEVQASGSWSEAQWDHRAFSVVENAAIAVGPKGEEETGLVLLPFSGWDESGGYTYATQIYTFSQTSLTARGVMVHGSPVRRSFVPEDDVAANLSDAELSLFSIADTDNPDETGRVSIAPNYSDVFVFGDYWVRMETGTDYWGGWTGGDVSPAKIEIVPASENPDAGTPVASIEIASGSNAFQSGNLLIAVSSLMDGSGDVKSTISVYDLTDPSDPKLASTLETNRIQPAYNNFYAVDDCVSCLVFMPWYGGNDFEAQSIPSGMVFLSRKSHYEYVESVLPEQGCDQVGDYPEACYWGGYRYWEELSLEVLDLSDPAAPEFAESVKLDNGSEGIGMLVDGSNVWLNFRRPVGVKEDKRPYVRYFIQQVDASDPGSPVVGLPINTPGQLLAVKGADAYTRDMLWGDAGNYVTLVARVKIEDDLAYLQASRAFPNQSVTTIVPDDNGRLIVESQKSWETKKMTILDAQSDDMDIVSETELNGYVELKTATAGKVLFATTGGLLVYNLDDPAKPYPQAFFTTMGWPGKILVHGKTALFAAGRFGIYAFNLDDAEGSLSE